MKKVPTLFERDWEGDRSRVLNVINPACQWVIDGEGVATHKLDGMCAAILGDPYKRREIKKGKEWPNNFVLCETDETTGKSVGYVPIGDGPEDKYFREALAAKTEWPIGTYELVGPKSQGGVEGYEIHQLIAHKDPCLIFDDQPPRAFEPLREWLKGKDIEGIVWHHADGRMAKIKKKDFGLSRND